MSNSDSTPKQTDEAGTSYRGGMGRAVFSAAVFGTIGAMFGKWLGKRGNCEKGQMAEPIMKWSMGAFWAVLAAYASLKAGESVATNEPKSPTSGREPEKHSPIRDYATASDSASLHPATQVHKATAAMQGLVQEHTPHMAAQK